MKDAELIKSMFILLLFILSAGFVLMAWSDQKTKEFIRKLDQKRLDQVARDSMNFLKCTPLINPIITCSMTKNEDKLIEKLRG